MQPQNPIPQNKPAVDREIPFTERAELLPDEELFALSDALIDKNHDAYRELAK